MTRIILAILIALTCTAHAAVEIVNEGGSTPWAVIDSEGVVVSQHQRQEKADERAVNEAYRTGGTYYVERLGRLRVTWTPDEPTEPPVDPPTDPVDPPVSGDDTIPEGYVVVYFDGPGGGSEGRLDTDGLTPETAITLDFDYRRPDSTRPQEEWAPDPWWRLKHLLPWVASTHPDKRIAVRFRRGDDPYPAFGRWCGQNKADPPWKCTEITGTADRYVILMGYGEGPRPVFDGSLLGGKFTLWTLGAYLELRGLAWRNSGVDSRSKLSGLRIVDCDFDNSNLIVEPTAGERFAGLDLTGNTWRNVDASGPGHRSGVFLSRVDDWTHHFNTYLKCGWELDENGDVVGQSTFNHGLYASGSCSPVKSAGGNVAIYNSGAGIQYRSAGVVDGDFAAWNGDRGINWGESLGAVTRDEPGSGHLRGSVAFQRNGHAITVGNVDSALVEGNVGISEESGAGLALISRHGPNSAGGSYFGLSKLTVTGNRFRGVKSASGAIMLSWDGWNVTGSGPVTIEGNVLDAPASPSAIMQWSNFADPNSGVQIGENESADLSGLTAPVMTPEFVAELLAKPATERAAWLIDTYGGSE